MILLRQIYRSLGRDAEGEDAARKGIERAEQELNVHPENPRPAYLGASALITVGETDRAKEWLARALAIDPDDALTQYNAACIYARIGEAEAAFDLLEHFIPHANHETKAWIKHDSDFDPSARPPSVSEDTRINRLNDF